MGKITETRQLYKEVINDITKSEEKWMSFLDSCAWNFKYDFDDKVLIYAQRPEAKACAEMEIWNKKVKRWVNKNAEGIFVLSKDENSPYPFKLVFDVSDTHNYQGTPYKLWEVKPEYEQEVIETLNVTFGGESKDNILSKAIFENSYNMVVDNIQDYMVEIQKYKSNSMLENMLDKEIESILVPTIWASVYYMMLTRCGIDARKTINIQELQYIKNFNSDKIITILGNAISDIAQIGLKEIAKTVINLQKNEKNPNRTFANNEKEEYSDNNEKIKGGIEDDKTRIHESRGLQYTKSNNETGKITNREIRNNEITLSKGEQQKRIYDTINGQTVSQTFNRNTRNSNENDKTNSGENGETRGYNRRIESQRPNNVGAKDEQLQANRRGTSNERTNLQLNILTEQEQKQNIAEAENVSAFSFTQEMIDSVLQAGSPFEDGKFRIYEQFSKSLSSQENAEFLKNEYGTGGRSEDDNGVIEDHSPKGIVLSFAHIENTPKLKLNWIQVEKRIRELISAERYLTDIEEDEYNDWLDASERPQINKKIENKIKDEEYKFAERLHSFIKDYDLYAYIDNVPPENTDEDNIELIRADINDELNIRDYIDFLKASYEDEDYDSELTVVARALLVELEKRLPYYEYEVGDVVYIGTRQFSISSINKDRVALRDTSFPILVEEMERKEFDRKVKENPGNDKVRTKKKVQEIIENTPIENIEKSKEISLFDKWLDTFIKEKGIDLDEIFSIESNGETHYFELGNVIENIKATSKEEQEEIRKMIVKIDFYNADVVDYFKHLAQTLVENYQNDRDETTVGKENIAVNKLIPNIKRKRRNKIEYFDLHPEIPLKDRKNYKITNNDLGSGTKKEKFRKNIEAIKVLKICEDENRYATNEEQEILAHYVGWGGIAEVFDKNNDEWTKEFQELSELLTEEEYNEAKESTLTSFYTPPIVINAIYEVLEKMGLKQGNILEPSCRCW